MRSFRRDHPRVCGEHACVPEPVEFVSGSSPRVRGTPRRGRVVRCFPGIIPACAGNTITPRVEQFFIRDHPRVCGEHVIPNCNTVGQSGSSPRVRGTHCLVAIYCSLLGIIPACAGNTWIRTSPHGTIGDHPRVCGEHLNLYWNPNKIKGSSPRVRGTHSLQAVPALGAGIIPACAGNTRRVSLARTSIWDHPRVCGEHGHRRFRACGQPGSSPRVRGTPSERKIPHVATGIIPACAGNTSSSGMRLSRFGDHPRVCGEHGRIVTINGNVKGSSPRVRGTLNNLNLPCFSIGIIPACAGNTLRK